MGIGGLGVEVGKAGKVGKVGKLGKVEKVGKVGKVGIRSGPVRSGSVWSKNKCGTKTPVRSGPGKNPVRSSPVRFGTKIRSGPKDPFRYKKSS